MYQRYEELLQILVFAICIWIAGISANADNIVIDSVCDQATYDMIYSTIVRIAAQSPLTAKDIKSRNDSIETLRQLCEGQLSSFEKGSKHD